MFDVSWGELFVMTGLSLAVIGRHDLPQACRFAGSQIGRVVGLLQGARTKADRFAQNHELKQLQNELRAGLRELDAVKAEIATSASGTLVGRGLGSTVRGANKRVVSQSDGAPYDASRLNPGTTSGVGPVGMDAPQTASRNVPSDVSSDSSATTTSSPAVLGRRLAPRPQTIAAVVEEEWEKRGIDFESRAESTQEPSGSKLLASLLQQTLIHDQYDRTIQEQEEALQSKADRIQERRNGANEE